MADVKKKMPQTETGGTSGTIERRERTTVSEMTHRSRYDSAVAEIVEQVRRLDRNEFEELLCWLADRELDELDAWDAKIADDSRPGGRLETVLNRVRKDIAEGNTKPLNEVLCTDSGSVIMVNTSG